MVQDWKKVVDDAKAEIETLEIRREAIDKRIEHLKRTIVAAKPLAEMTESSEANTLLLGAEGFTDACRHVLRSSQQWMSPLSVRAALEANGLDLSKQSNAMASVHAVLKRLKEKGEVRSDTASDGGTVYKWRPSLFRRPRRLDPVPAPEPSAILGEPTPPPIPISSSGYAPVPPPRPDGALRKTLLGKVEEFKEKE